MYDEDNNYVSNNGAGTAWGIFLGTIVLLAVIWWIGMRQPLPDKFKPAEQRQVISNVKDQASELKDDSK